MSKADTPSMRYRVHHHTAYQYAAPVQVARHVLHLSPRQCAWQTVLAKTVAVDPIPDAEFFRMDGFGNPLICIELSHPHTHLNIDSIMELNVAARPWAGATETSAPWEVVRDRMVYHAGAVDEELCHALRQRFESPNVRVKHELEIFAQPSFDPGRPVLEATADLMARIHSEFTYDPEATDVGTSVLEVLERKRGVCQDFAHLMIGSLRAIGLSARYVSGYLRTDPPAGQPRMVGADASHAWVAVYVPDLGWVEFDPTNDCLADQRHLVLGWGRDFSDVSPVRGVIQGGGEHTLDVGVTVTPMDELVPASGDDGPPS